MVWERGPTAHRKEQWISQRAWLEGGRCSKILDRYSGSIDLRRRRQEIMQPLDIWDSATLL